MQHYAQFLHALRRGFKDLNLVFAIVVQKEYNIIKLKESPKFQQKLLNYLFFNFFAKYCTLSLSVGTFINLFQIGI